MTALERDGQARCAVGARDVAGAWILLSILCLYIFPWGADLGDDDGTAATAGDPGGVDRRTGGAPAGRRTGIDAGHRGPRRDRARRDQRGGAPQRVPSIEGSLCGPCGTPAFFSP